MKRWLFVLIPALILGTLIAVRVREKKAEAAAQSQVREARMKAVPVVSVATVINQDIVETYGGVGTAEAPYNIRISAKTTGRIEYLEAREGDKIKAGQVLVRLDPTEIEGQVQQARAAVAEARSRLAQAMLTQGPTNTSIQTNIRQQVAAVDVAKSDLNLVLTNSESKKANQHTFITDAEGRVRNAEAAIGNAEASVKSAAANLDNAKAKFNRINGLYKEGFIAAQDVDDERTQVSVMQGALDVAGGQVISAKAIRDSMLAQKEASEKQYTIGVNGVKADTAAAQARVRQSQAALDYAKSNTAQKPAYEENIAALRSSVTAAEASVRSAEARRSDTILTAPIAGSVAARLMDPGATATSGQPILSLVATNHIWITFGVPEEVNRRVAVGMPVTVTFDALPDRQFIAKVVQQNPSADPTNRQFQVRAAIDNSQNILKPGMFARFKLVTARTPNAIVAPLEAVQKGAQGNTVVVVDENNKAHRRPVTLGPANADVVSITSGIQPGEKVVILSAAPVKDETAVRIGVEKAGDRGVAGRTQNGAGAGN